MSLRIDIAWLLASALVSLRVAAATMLAPVLGPTQIPATVRVLLAFGLGAMFIAAIPIAPIGVESAAQLARAACTELLIGASLSLGFLCAYGATQFAGRALDIQIGFGVASVFNPAAQGFAPLLGTVLGIGCVAVFLGLDGHHVLLQVLAQSVRNVPPGTTLTYTPAWGAILAQSGVMFSFGLAFAAPVMLMLFLADLTLAVMARSMPMLNVFIFSFTIKVVLGLAALAASIRLSEGLLESLFGRTFRYWAEVIGQL